ncbi:type I secretion system permease/ATPase [Methylobacillus flagellatus]|uniref:Type I secretion system ATPase, PrtD n=1 Tax=Methylobacillus flagellatus (strain ATCC 51484 / DSM 6875 / VKM B-1610 / KT) TaxID=265072 RepID=Q1H1M2_METFK|nr:type I secretion system permease/ATPase [Methylobacillus flagellatus]ABE49615.1 Type I secretion system ATPase, PrtD [Methylobacillus flagellatus KT]
MNRPPASLRGYLALFRREAWAIAAFSMVTNILMLAPTLYLLQLYDRVLLSRSEMTLLAVTLITVFLFMVMAFSDWVRSMVAIKAGVRFDQLLTSRLFSLGLTTQAPALNGTHQAMQELTFIRHFVTSNGLFAFFDLPWTLLYVAVLFVLSPILGTLAIALCLVQFGLALWNQRSTALPLEKTAEARQQGLQFLDSKLRNIETLHVLGMLPSLWQRWVSIQSRWHALDAQANQVQSRNQQVNKFARYTMQSGMLGVAALLAVKGDISIGAMIASNVLIARTLQPFDVIVSTWKQFIQAKASASNIDQLLASAHGEEDPVYLTTPGEPIKGRLALVQIAVKASGGKPLLRPLNLDIEPGEILGILGPSGSGKTTLVRCIAGICDNREGEILVDGIALSRLPANVYAAAIGYLPQEVALLEGSIAENIARFTQPDPEKVIQAAQTAGIHDAILRLPRGYDTRIDAEAPVLSGGQRQLLGLARAIYQQPAVIILDEPNSHLDDQGEASLITALLLLKNQGKAIVIVSHRTHILNITDKLLVLDQGAMVCHGPRDQVIAELNRARQTPASKVA